MTLLLGQFNDSPADVIAQLLIDLGYVEDPNLAGTAKLIWPVSVDSELASPDDIVCITNTDPVNSGRVQVTGQMSELWGIQFKVRAVDPQVAYRKSNQLVVAMDQEIYHQTTIIHPTATTSGGTYFVGAITRKSGPLSLGREASATKRSLYTINAIVDIIQTA
jgi:hypothetical protein